VPQHHFWNSRNGSFGLQGQDEPDKSQTPRSTEEIRSPFVCTDGGPEVATLIGVDFARLAKLVVNYYHNDTYHFHDASHEENAFVRKEKHAALPLSPFKAVQPEPMEEDVLDDPYQSPVDFDEFIKSDEWSDITRDYGPIVSPLPPISPHGPTDARNSSRIIIYYCVRKIRKMGFSKIFIYTNTSQTEIVEN
jgi:hypothetical protein